LLTKSDYNNIKVVVIGCGNWGKNLIRVLNQLGALAGICDADLNRAATISEEFGVPSIPMQELISDESIHAVVIATPSVTHFEVAQLCLKAKKHTFVEKPLALSLEHAEELQKLALKNNRTLMVGHLLQYHSAYSTLKKMIKEDKLGKLQYLYSNRLNLGKFRTEENIWWDYAPHDVSMILGLVGKLPDSVTATGANYLKHTHADVTNTQLNFPDNIKAHIFVSWLHPFKEQKLVVVGEKAMAIFDDCAPWPSKLKLYPYPVDWVDGLPQPWRAEAEDVPLEVSEPLLCECQHFLDSVLQQTNPRTDGKEGINVMHVLHGAMESINTKQPYILTSESNRPQVKLRNQELAYE
jgi:UDP-2-acetamido-3-amino-2,3-dideoxy-glucuronate N-acetyltransferase